MMAEGSNNSIRVVRASSTSPTLSPDLLNSYKIYRVSAPAWRGFISRLKAGALSPKER